MLALQAVLRTVLGKNYESGGRRDDRGEVSVAGG